MALVGGPKKPVDDTLADPWHRAIDQLRDQLAEATRADNPDAIERIDFRFDILEAVEGD